MGAKWTTTDIPDQSGRIAIITGSNTGIGFSCAAAMAAKGAQVVLAVRDLDKGDAAARRITAECPHANVTLTQLDLTSLESIRVATKAMRATYPRIDLLVNNAGVMYTDKATTQDGFELQFGTNHLGHFALTAQLLDNMLRTDGSRVVTVSSMGHRMFADIHFEDLQFERRYNRAAAYGQSKLANLLFTYELARRLAVRGSPTIAVAAHPGASDTELARNVPAAFRPIAGVWNRVAAQSAEMGALPTLRAATDLDVQNAQYYGPGGISKMRGYPALVTSSARSHNQRLQRQLWAVSEELTGAVFPV
jgi:NAD(P)-dependent dehydrogenase (short-subunit alcohol dehydrogenase family)